MQHLLRQLTLCIFALASTRALANIYSYDVDGFPPSVGTCENAKAFVRARFEAMTHLPVMRVECTPHTHSFETQPLSYLVRVFYNAERRLRMIEVGDPALYGYLGTYGFERECLADLNHQIDLFQRATQLQATVAYCYHMTELQSHPWEVHIDAFGNTAAYPQRYQALVSYNFVPNRVAIARAIQQKLEAKGVFVRSVDFSYIDPEGSYFDVSYYAFQPLAFRVLDETYATQQLCEYQRGQINQIYARDHYEPLSTFCAVRGVDDWSLITIVAGDWPYQTVMLPMTYATLAECNAAVPGAIAGYDDHDGMTVHGAYCTGSTGFSIVVLKAYEEIINQ